MARVHVINSIEEKQTSGWTLCFQWCLYMYDDKSQDTGYRFIWKRPDGALQAARGQARLPNIEIITRLLEAAKKAGWAYEGSPKSI